jgi:hypothetical protein
MVDGPSTLEAQCLIPWPLVLHEMAPPTTRPPRELHTPLASLPPMILYECICVCDDGCLHKNEHELSGDDQLHYFTE